MSKIWTDEDELELKRAKRAAYMRKYRAENPEAEKARKAKYAAANRKKIAEYQRNYYMCSARYSWSMMRGRNLT